VANKPNRLNSHEKRDLPAVFQHDLGSPCTVSGHALGEFERPNVRQIAVRKGTLSPPQC
jgi:hypothetical protein